MTERRKRAYHHLLYVAMLDIRTACCSQSSVNWKPRQIWEQYQHSRRVGQVADWLHNLAAYSKRNFKGFNEDWFWREYEGYKSRFPDSWPDYKQEFEDELERWERQRAAKHD